MIKKVRVIKTMGLMVVDIIFFFNFYGSVS